MMGARGQATARDSALAYTDSTRDDARMILADIWGSRAHVLMLAHCGIVTDEHARRILEALNAAQTDAEAGRLELDPKLEDVHMNVEAYVVRAAGEAYGGRLHTARSRNDQVLTDARLTIREELLAVETAAVELARAFLDIAEEHADVILPGYTHTQHAQPITLGFWATAYASLFMQDLRRLKTAYATVNTNPLGACALAGADFPIDRRLTAELLGFDSVEEHALAVISGRDFILEPLFALTALMTNLSRLSAEIVYGTTFEFRLMTLHDAYALGSSIMPQKKNPDIAELARGRAGKVIGRLMAVLTTLKGLPLGYHSDLQEDKPPLWESFDTTRASVEILTELVRTMRFNEDRMRELTYANFATATELANHLVRERGLPFRESHRLVGSLVAALVERGLDFRDLDACAQFLATRGHTFDVDTLSLIFDPAEATRRNRSEGGTSPASVEAMRGRIARRLDEHERDVARRRDGIDGARAKTERAIARVLDRCSAREALSTPDMANNR